MRYALLLVALLVVGCAGSRPAPNDEYRVQEEDDGSVSITLSENASSESMITALREAAGFVEWEPPQAVPGLERVSDEDLGEYGHLYSYSLDGNRFDVFVYRHPGDADMQVEEIELALGQLVQMGRIDAYTLHDQSTRDVPWEGGEAELHRAVFEEIHAGRRWTCSCI